MNIFYLSHDPDESARFQTDSHCVKMILETAQILSTNHRLLDGRKEIIRVNGRNRTVWLLPDKDSNEKLYGVTHANHPSTVWARQSDSNYLWLVSYFDSMLREYTHRYGRHHKTGELLPFLKSTPRNISAGPFTEPTPAMPPEYIVPNDSIASYRAYYNGGKTHLFRWTKREPPDWIDFLV